LEATEQQPICQSRLPNTQIDGCLPSGLYPNLNFGQQDMRSQLYLSRESCDLQQPSLFAAPPPVLPGSRMSHGYSMAQREVPQPQTISTRENLRSGSFEFVWNVDARKLKSVDKQAVSPPFELPLNGQNVTFKMMLYPTVKSEGKGGASFKNSKGRGYISIKCEGDVSNDYGGNASNCPAQVNFNLAIGSRGVRLTEQGARSGKHNFAQSAICTLPGNANEWHFSPAVDPESDTFAVFLDMQLVRTWQNATSSIR